MAGEGTAGKKKKVAKERGGEVWLPPMPYPRGREYGH